jgi:DhnA family fructose-bisphosphate aldolase class Ia
MSTGKTVRLNRLLRADGKTVIIALDHGIAGMSPLAALEHPGNLIPSLISAGADALLVTPGLARNFCHLFGRAGIILRIDCGPTALTGEWSETRPALSVEDAQRLGADAVAAMGIVGAPGESASLHALAQVASHCERCGMVLLAEMLPGGFSASQVSAEQVAVATRLGAEIGADLVKIRYSGSPDSFRKVTSASYRPVVVLGGSKQSEQQLLSATRDALEAGGKGVAVGRNVWQAADPAAITRSLVETVHG